MTEEQLKVTVLQTKLYSSFQALLKDYSNQDIGVREEMQLSQKLAAIYQIYSQSEELEPIMLEKMNKAWFVIQLLSTALQSLNL